MEPRDRTIGSTRLVALTGDLTQQDVGAVVNAANQGLKHGGGVAAAISKAGGPTIQRESDAFVTEHGELKDGTAAVTSAGDMPAEAVVHVAGPIYDDARDDNEARLRSAVRGAMNAAADEGHRTVAFPAISAGIYGYPADDATAILVDEVAAAVRDRSDAFDEVRFVGFDDTMTERFAAGLDALDD